MVIPAAAAAAILPSRPLFFIESVYDLVTISLITSLILFSLVSLAFVFHIHLKSRQSRHLQNFNSLWSVRILFVVLILFWALTELLRLPFTRRHLFPSPSLTQEAYLCQCHIVLSLGLFEPGFLVTLLFLVSFSIKQKDPNDKFGSAVATVFALCLPILLLLGFFIFLASKTHFPQVFWKTYVVLKGSGVGGGDAILCTYPLFGTIIFGTFATAYILLFLLSSFKVVALVINKGLRIRIYALALSVLVALPTQVTLLSLSILSRPEDPIFDVLELVMFLAVLLCAMVGEGIVIIRPIADALAVGGNSCLWRHNRDRQHLPVVFENVPVALEEGSHTTAS